MRAPRHPRRPGPDAAPPAAAMRLALSILVLVVTLGSAAADPPSAATLEREAHALEERLVAPCCWRETLNSHPSPLADQLRQEIRTRLAAGESAATIQDDLIARYGPRIRALPGDWEPRRMASILWLVGSVVLLGLLVRWVRRRIRPPTAVAAPAPATDESREDALDDELRAIDV